MKLEKIYKFKEKGQIAPYYSTLKTLVYFEDGDSRERTEGYFITKEQLEDIISEAYIEGHTESAYRLFREGYTEEKLKEIEK